MRGRHATNSKRGEINFAYTHGNILIIEIGCEEGLFTRYTGHAARGNRESRIVLLLFLLLLLLLDRRRFPPFLLDHLSFSSKRKIIDALLSLSLALLETGRRSRCRAVPYTVRSNRNHFFSTLKETSTRSTLVAVVRAPRLPGALPLPLRTQRRGESRKGERERKRERRSGCGAHNWEEE